MLMQLDFSSDVPIYRQIRDQLVLGIASGDLNAGDKLPTIRALANEIGVNVMTVNKSYQILKQEGFITADRRGGTVVSGQGSEALAKNISAELNLSAASAKLAGLSREKWLDICGQAFDDLSNDI